MPRAEWGLRLACRVDMWLDESSAAYLTLGLMVPWWVSAGRLLGMADVWAGGGAKAESKGVGLANSLPESLLCRPLGVLEGRAPAPQP